MGAKRYDLSTNITPGQPKKAIIRKIDDKRALMLCRHHGITEFYINPSGKPECLLCRRQHQKINHSTDSYKKKKNEWVRKRRSTKLGNYEHRFIPISSALSREQLATLFDLNNLSLLCLACNRYVKKDRLDIRYE